VWVFVDEGRPMQRCSLSGWPRPGRSLRDYAVRFALPLSWANRVWLRQARKSLPRRYLVEPLSQRELEVLHLMALGSTNQEIAQQLVVALGTIKPCSQHLSKADVTNRTRQSPVARQLVSFPSPDSLRR